MKKEWFFGRSVLIILFVFLILLLSGCQPREGELVDNIHTGTEGISMNFIPNNPPNKVTASTGMEVNFALEIKNKGAAPLRGYLYFSGFAREILGLPDMYIFPDPVNCGVDYIEPKSKFYTSGGTCIEYLPALLNLNSVPDEIPFPILVTAIYPYTTDAAVPVCIDPNYHKLGNKACEMRPVTMSGGQGAPVAVTRVEPIPMSGGKVQFNIFLTNVGGGEIVDYTRTRANLRTGKDYNFAAYTISAPVSFSSLTGSAIENVIIRGDKYYIAYGDNLINILIGGNFNTASAGIVRFNNNQAVISRVIDFGNKPSEFVTPLRITLFYGYKEDIRTTLHINKIPNEEMDSLFPALGFYPSQHGYSLIYEDMRYAGAYYENPYGNDVWRFMDKEKQIDVIFTTT